LNEEKKPAGNVALDQLEHIAGAADANAETAANPPAPGEQVPGAPDYKKSGAVITDMVVGMIVGYEPKCAQFWPDETRARVADAAAAVMEKYQMTLDAFPPELTLLMLAGPPLYQCSKLIAESMNNPRPQANAAAATSAPGAAVPAGSGAALVVHGQESGTASHSQAMMDLKL
jgi:hypothetical protein